MFAIDVRWEVIAEIVLPPHAPRDLSDDPPVGPRLTGQRHKGPLTADQPYGLGDGAVLFAPRRCGQLYMRIAAGVSVSDAVLHDDKGTGRQRLPNPVPIGQPARRIVRHYPNRLDSPFGPTAAAVHGLHPLLRGLIRRGHTA